MRRGECGREGETNVSLEAGREEGEGEVEE
jgi:hypothetical protein